MAVTAETGAPRLYPARQPHTQAVVVAVRITAVPALAALAAAALADQGLLQEPQRLEPQTQAAVAVEVTEAAHHPLAALVGQALLSFVIQTRFQPPPLRLDRLQLQRAADFVFTDGLALARLPSEDFRWRTLHNLTKTMLLCRSSLFTTTSC